jgi:hypothetical protein
MLMAACTSPIVLGRVSTLGGLTGEGIFGFGGATGGAGIRGKGVNGEGLLAEGGTASSGIRAAGAGAGNGLLCTAGPTGHGGEYRGGVTSGHGLYCLASTNGNGLQIEGGGAGDSFNADSMTQITNSIWDEPEASHVAADTIGLAISRLRKWRTNREKVNAVTNRLELYDDNGTSIIQQFDLTDSDGNPTSVAIYERVSV